MMILQMDNPQGQVESSQDFVPQRRMDGTRTYVPGPILLRVHLRGYAYEWAPGTTQIRKATSINGRQVEESPHVVDSTYREIEDQ